MKPRLSYLKVFVPLAIGLVGCTKEDKLSECLGSCTVVTGKLLTSDSAPLSNTLVTLEWSGRPSGFGGYKARKKAVGTTDTDGRYRLSSFLTDEELAEGYMRVVFSPDNSKYYLIGQQSVAFSKYERDTILTAPNYLIPRKAFVKLTITNPSQIPSPSAYSSTFNTCYGGNTVFSSAISGGGSYINWSVLPTQNPLEIAGDQPVLVRHFKNGALPVPTDTIFVPAGTTRSYTVTY